MKVLLAILVLAGGGVAITAIARSDRKLTAVFTMLLMGLCAGASGLIIGQSDAWQAWSAQSEVAPLDGPLAERTALLHSHLSEARSHERKDTSGHELGQTDRTLFARALDWPGGEVGSVDFEVVRDSVEGRIRRVELVFQGFQDAWIPMIILAPLAERALPGVMTIPGHVPDGDSGLLRLTDPDDTSYLHGAAAQLSRHGFAAAAIELRGFGYLGRPRFIDHLGVAFNAHLADSSYKAIILQDIRRAWSVFSRLVKLDERRLAVAGASLGAELAVAYGALDQSMGAVISHAYGGRLGPIEPVRVPGERQRHYCHVLSSDSARIPVERAFQLISPRPLLALRGAADTFANPAFAGVVAAAWPGVASDIVVIEEVTGGHEFFVDETIEFLKSQLNWLAER